MTKIKNIVYSNVDNKLYTEYGTPNTKEDILKNKVKITETCLRDGHQSLIATRLTTAEILPIVEKMDEVGYHALEVWGGATFDACIVCHKSG